MSDTCERPTAKHRGFCVRRQRNEGSNCQVRGDSDTWTTKMNIAQSMTNDKPVSKCKNCYEVLFHEAMYLSVGSAGEYWGSCLLVG
jgi:hypothetical protein